MTLVEGDGDLSDRQLLKWVQNNHYKFCSVHSRLSLSPRASCDFLRGLVPRLLLGHGL